MTAQTPGIFNNQLLGEIPCSSEGPRDAWRSMQPLTPKQVCNFGKRKTAADEFQPDGGEWVDVGEAHLDASFLVVTGVPISDWDTATEQ